jgi:hypothetical protein
MWMGGSRHAPAALPQEWPATHFIGGGMGPTAGLNGCGKSLSHGDSLLILMNLINDLWGSRCNRSLLVKVETNIYLTADSIQTNSELLVKNEFVYSNIKKYYILSVQGCW